LSFKQVVVVGGGIVGCMTAMELVKRGCHVTIIERNQIASQTSGEASWAGGGILCTLLPWMYMDHVNQLALKGASLYPEVCQQLQDETGIDPEYTRSGMLIKPDFDHKTALDWCRKFNVPIERVGEDLLLKDVAQVRNPRLMGALKKWLIQHQVTIIEQTQLLPLVENELEQAGLVRSWQTYSGEKIEADAFVVTSGAWSYELLKETTQDLKIKPMRGQILLYQLPPEESVNHIVYQNGFYLVPRRDGHLIAGSTLEDVGFDTGVTEAVKLELMAKAEALLPKLKNYPIERHWSGLRPGTPDNLPTISAHPTIKNLFLNTGHFRYGLTMAPASAKLVVALMLGNEPIVDVTPYACQA
jgi:glycine oxidase